MNTILDKQTRNELIDRIQTLEDTSTPNWGTMNVHQMIGHCITWEEMFTGKQTLRQAFIGRLFGKIALKSMTGDDNPVKRNMPTLPQLKITVTTSDIESNKAKWIALIQQNALTPNPNFLHPFFGKMTIEQIGILAY